MWIFYHVCFIKIYIYSLGTSVGVDVEECYPYIAACKWQAKNMVLMYSESAPIITPGLCKSFTNVTKKSSLQYNVSIKILMIRGKISRYLFFSFSWNIYFQIQFSTIIQKCFLKIFIYIHVHSLVQRTDLAILFLPSLFLMCCTILPTSFGEKGPHLRR